MEIRILNTAQQTADKMRKIRGAAAGVSEAIALTIPIYYHTFVGGITQYAIRFLEPFPSSVSYEGANLCLTSTHIAKQAHLRNVFSNNLKNGTPLSIDNVIDINKEYSKQNPWAGVRDLFKVYEHKFRPIRTVMDLFAPTQKELLGKVERTRIYTKEWAIYASDKRNTYYEKNNWIIKAKITEADGKPRIVYHSPIFSMVDMQDFANLRFCYGFRLCSEEGGFCDTEYKILLSRREIIPASKVHALIRKNRSTVFDGSTFGKAIYYGSIISADISDIDFENLKQRNLTLESAVKHGKPVYWKKDLHKNMPKSEELRRIRTAKLLQGKYGRM